MESKERRFRDELEVKPREKKTYSKPQLTLHGSLKKMTKVGHGKSPGGIDSTMT